MNENWNVLCRFLPKGWIQKSRELGAFTRSRNISSPNKLLRLLLIHVADGHSLRETTAIAKQSRLCDLSDVALYERLKSSAEWFRWMSLELLKNKGIQVVIPQWLKPYKIKTVDATVITEPGSTGTDWRLHYSMNLFELGCDQFVLSQPSVGESFTNFKVDKGDLIIGDRAYGTINGIKHVLDCGGDYLVRLQSNPFKFYAGDTAINLIDKIKNLKEGKLMDLNLSVNTKQGEIFPIRVCVLRKTKSAADKSIKKANKEASKKQHKIKPETIELCKYIVIATSLPKSIRAELILELYRYRWQVEIAFKRLKSIMLLGHLPKKDEQSCKAWLQGKIFTALLTNAVVNEGRLFSPWGYPLRRAG